MVDALRRAHRLLRSDGLLFDLHPSGAPVDVEVGIDRGRVIVGTLADAGARLRYAAAEAALRVAIADGLFAVDAVRECSFRRTASSLDELLDYIKRKWDDAWIDEPTQARIRLALRDAPHAPVSVREDVRLRRLSPH